VTGAPSKSGGRLSREMDAATSLPRRPHDAPYLGVGVGLRPVHYGEIFERAEAGTLEVDFLEVLSENFMVPGGKPLRMLDRACAARPVVMHGVSLNIGSVDPLDEDYLDELAALAARTQPRWLSDHLCWTGVGGHPLHDLIPLPYCEESIRHVAGRVRAVQERLGRRIALENVSSYLSFERDAMPEWEFLAAVCEEADCGILLDVNNVFVSAHNHGFRAGEYIDAMPAERVFQIHLAGHSESPPLLIDTHDHPVSDEVWDLYAYTLERLGPISTSIEWDAHIPPLSRLLEEVERARTIAERVAQEAQEARETNS
jgi:uncharacterized protein (UPF0276 family)